MVEKSQSIAHSRDVDQKPPLTYAELCERLQALADGSWYAFADDPEIQRTASEALRYLGLLDEQLG